MATIRDVAKEAGVAVCTVSFAMNGSAHVAEGTKKRIFAAIEKLNYRPNQSARGLVTKRTQNIGLAVPVNVRYMEGTVLSDIVQGTGEVAAEYDYDLFLSFQKKDTAEQQNHFILDMFRKRSADGLILFGAKLKETSYLELVKQRFPFVLISRPAIENVCYSVDVDNVAAAYQATSYLIAKGHRKIGFIPPSEMENGVAVDRLQGYRNAMREAGLPDNDWVVFAPSYPSNGLQEARQLLESPKQRPTAIVAGRDKQGTGVLDVAKELGLSVPDDLAVVGIENSILSQLSRPALTSVEIPMREMGNKAAHILLDLIRGEKTYDDPQHAIVPTRLIERESS